MMNSHLSLLQHGSAMEALQDGRVAASVLAQKSVPPTEAESHGSAIPEQPTQDAALQADTAVPARVERQPWGSVAVAPRQAFPACNRSAPSRQTARPVTQTSVKMVAVQSPGRPCVMRKMPAKRSEQLPVEPQMGHEMGSSRTDAELRNVEQHAQASRRQQARELRLSVESPSLIAQMAMDAAAGGSPESRAALRPDLQQGLPDSGDVSANHSSWALQQLSLTDQHAPSGLHAVRDVAPQVDNSCSMSTYMTCTSSGEADDLLHCAAEHSRTECSRAGQCHVLAPRRISGPFELNDGIYTHRSIHQQCVPEHVDVSVKVSKLGQSLHACHPAQHQDPGLSQTQTAAADGLETFACSLQTSKSQALRLYRHDQPTHLATADKQRDDQVAGTLSAVQVQKDGSVACNCLVSIR
jgi:hypothetical protein